MFYGSSAAYNIAFLMLALKWPQLMSKWSKIEKLMATYSWPVNFKMKIQTLAFGILIIATGYDQY
jgi:Trehalose receptor